MCLFTCDHVSDVDLLLYRINGALHYGCMGWQLIGRIRVLNLQPQVQDFIFDYSRCRPLKVGFQVARSARVTQSRPRRKEMKSKLNQTNKIKRGALRL